MGGVAENALPENGKEARLALVRSPAGEWHGPLCQFLNSAPQPEGPPLHVFLLANEMPGLDARYFIALHEGGIIGCVVTTDSASVGYRIQREGSRLRAT